MMKMNPFSHVEYETYTHDDGESNYIKAIKKVTYHLLNGVKPGRQEIEAAVQRAEAISADDWRIMDVRPRRSKIVITLRKKQGGDNVARTLREKLNFIKACETRNLEREHAHYAKVKAEYDEIHLSIERYANTVMGGMETLAERYDVPRRELVELLADTILALEQYKEQEDGNDA